MDGSRTFTVLHCIALRCVVQALEELRRFMIVNGEALKEKQKLMRNLRVS